MIGWYWRVLISASQWLLKLSMLWAFSSQMMLQHNRLRLLLKGTHVSISLADVDINAINLEMMLQHDKQRLLLKGTHFCISDCYSCHCYELFSSQIMLQHSRLRLLLKGMHVSRSLGDRVVNVFFSNNVTVWLAGTEGYSSQHQCLMKLSMLWAFLFKNDATVWEAAAATEGYSWQHIIGQPMLTTVTERYLFQYQWLLKLSMLWAFLFKNDATVW